jgi:hypothetical protein
VDPNFQIEMSQSEETEEGHLRFALTDFPKERRSGF